MRNTTVHTVVTAGMQFHVIERANRKRPFQVSLNGRMVSFASLDAAASARTRATLLALNEMVAREQDVKRIVLGC